MAGIKIDSLYGHIYNLFTSFIHLFIFSKYFILVRALASPEPIPETLGNSLHGTKHTSIHTVIYMYGAV